MPSITLTGADEATPLHDLLRLAKMGAEIGLLYTFSPDGRNRYPRLPWIVETAAALNGMAAIHICGTRARAALVRGNLGYMIDDVNRIQVNGRLSPSDLTSICDAIPAHTIITQHNEGNLRLCSLLADNHALLADSSGGNGKSPDKWVRPHQWKHCGFAGGLGPDNLAEELPKIEEAAGTEHFWIDMEGKLRDKDDFFSVEKAMRVMELWTERIGS